MLIRISQRRSPFSADKNHLHHRLLTLGFSHKNATYTIVGINILFVAVLFSLHQFGILRIGAYIVISCGTLFFMPAFFIKKRNLVRKNNPLQKIMIPRLNTDSVFAEKQVQR